MKNIIFQKGPGWPFFSYLHKIDRQQEEDGFTLSELIITVAIVATLSSVALPSFFRQFQKTEQSEAATTLTQFQQKLANYVDEYKSIPDSWKSLSDYSLIMTSTGPATPTSLLSPTAIELAGKKYTVSTTKNGTDLYTFHAIPSNPKANSNGYNVMACIDLENGATDLKKGPIARDDEDQDPSVNTTDLICRACMKNNNCT